MSAELTALLRKIVAKILVPADLSAAGYCLSALGERCRKLRAPRDAITQAFAEMVGQWPTDVQPAPDEILGAIDFYSVDSSAFDLPPEKGKSKLCAYVRRDTELIAEFPVYHAPIIDGLLRHGETLNIIAAPKVGKSWLVNYLAYSIANGQPWLGRTCSRHNVLILDNELHQATAARRLHSVKSALIDSGMEFCSDYHLDIMSLRGENANIEKLSRELILYMQEENIGVLVLDALYRMLPDGCSENDNTMMMKIYNKIDLISKLTGAAIIVIHHTSKGDQSNKSVTDIGAGAGSISRAADGMVALRAHDQEGLICVHMTARSWPPETHEPFVIRRNGIMWEIVDWANPEDQKGSDMSRRANGQRPLTADELLKLITNKPLPIDYFKGKTGASHKSIQAFIEVFIESGSVQLVKEGSKNLYMLTGSDYQSRRDRAQSQPSDEEDVFTRKLSSAWVLEIIEGMPLQFTDILNITECAKSSLSRLLAKMVEEKKIVKTTQDNGEYCYATP